MNLDMVNNNYLSLRGLIDPSRAELLAKDFKKFVKENNKTGDAQAPNSPSVYNYMPFVKLLVELTPKISEMLGEQVLPTYSYARVYSKKEILHRHRDRPACEVSVTLNLSKDKDWAIWFQRADGSETSINMEPGDGAMYFGCIADHWREPFKGKEYTQVFLHYVRAEGPNSWAFFDNK
jgi:hypothetical protein